ncbi:MAG: nitrilase-related carbon-nitrogen hydrolase [Anaerolineales bacterium]
MRSKRTIIGIILSLASGACFYLAFPPLNIWPLIFIAVTLYLIAQHRLFPLKWSALAPTIALGIWLWPFLYRIFNIEGAPFWLLHMGLLIAVFTFFTSTDRKFNEGTGFRWFVLQGLFAWVGFEMIRSFIPFLGTMGFVANPLAGQAWLVQPVSIFSIYGLNLVVILVNFALAQAAIVWIDRKWPSDDVIPADPGQSRSWLIAAGVILMAWIGLSLIILNQQPDSANTVRVAALQMDIADPGHQVDDAGQEARLDLLGSLLQEAAEKGAKIAYVPEMAFGFDPQTRYTDRILDMVAQAGTYLYFTYAYHDDAGWHNETVLISPEGDFSPIYGKQHAFGEPPTATAGTYPINPTPYGKLGSIICMDGVFTDSARKTVSRGAQLLGIPSYDTTVGISEQNWTHFVMRSVENQVPVINADRGFYSMITDSHGRIVADIRSNQGSSQVILADVVPAQRRSLYTQLGNDWLGYASLAGYIFFIFFPGILAKREKKGNQEI